VKGSHEHVAMLSLKPSALLLHLLFVRNGAFLHWVDVSSTLQQPSTGLPWLSSGL